MDAQIIKNGEELYLSNYDIIVKDFVVEGMEAKDTYIQQDGVHGRQLVDSVYSKRKISVPCLFSADSNAEYATQRALLMNLVQDTKPFYIRELRKLKRDGYEFHDTTEDDYQAVDSDGLSVNSSNTSNDFVDGKRYLVKLSNVLKPLQKNNMCNVELEFETVELPFAESIGTSIDLEQRQQDESWSEDMNIDFEDEGQTTYTFTNTSQGNVFYHGTQPINQYNQECNVTIVIGKKTNNFEWTLSSGEVMYIKLDLDENDIIFYDGLRVLKNGIAITERTGLTQPKLTHGYNRFKFNQTVKKVVFDMRFYFKG